MWPTTGPLLVCPIYGNIIGNEIYFHFQKFSLFPQYQKGIRRGIWGTKEQQFKLEDTMGLYNPDRKFPTK